MGQNKVEVNAVHLGPNGTIADFNESSLPVSGALGQKFWNNAKQYQIVKVHADTAAPAPALGKIAYWQDADDFVVGDHSLCEAGSGKINCIAGVYACTTGTAGNYVIIQKKGKNTAVLTSGSVAVDDMLIGLNLNTGAAGFTAAGTAPTNNTLGRCASSGNASGYVTAFLNVEE